MASEIVTEKPEEVTLETGNSPRSKSSDDACVPEKDDAESQEVSTARKPRAFSVSLCFQGIR